VRKRHGAWQFHRILRRANKSRAQSGMEPIRWHADDDRWRNSWQFANEATSARFSGECTNASAIKRCAYRYFRLCKITPTVAQWNEAVYTIACRAGWHHHATRRAAELSGYRAKAPVRFEEDGEPYCDRSLYQIELRLRSSKETQAAKKRQSFERRVKAWGAIHDAKQDINTIRQAINRATEAHKRTA
jgi:hypothetical protein